MLNFYPPFLCRVLAAILKFLRIHELNTKFNYERQIHNAVIVLLKTSDLSLCLHHEYLKMSLKKNIGK